MSSSIFFLILLTFHWYSSLFFQTIFLHRYCSHNMFKLSGFLEKFFYVGTFIFQGASFLNPHAYAVLHLMHHKHSDDEKDPHSPMKFKNVFLMMLHTFKIYQDILKNPNSYSHIKTSVKRWESFDRFADSWLIRIAHGSVFVIIYFLIAEYWWQYLLIPLHWLMGPIHGAIVNWCGHKYGYENFKNGDNSKNTLAIDFLMMGELYQNNHHKYPTHLNFAKRFFEIDFGYLFLSVLKSLRLIR